MTYKPLAEVDETGWYGIKEGTEERIINVTALPVPRNYEDYLFSGPIQKPVVVKWDGADGF